MQWDWYIGPENSSILNGLENSSVLPQTPIGIATALEQKEALAFLLRHGADVESSGESRNTALHCAARTGSLHALITLINAKADIDCRTYRGDTPMMLAAKEGHTRILEELTRRGAELTATNITGRGALQFAAENGQLRSLYCLTALGSRISYTTNKRSLIPEPRLLYLTNQAVEEFNIDFVPANYTDPLSSADLIYPVFLNVDSSGLQRIIERARNEGTILRLVNSSSTAYAPPLYYAAYMGYVGHIEILLDNGADLDTVWGEYGTALGVACAMARLKAAKTLAKRGAKPS